MTVPHTASAAAPTWRRGPRRGNRPGEPDDSRSHDEVILARMTICLYVQINLPKSS
jgi:hypothetical protein